ncbi:MAG: hypothetical protein Q4D16_17440 [Eubacteriales bacterium]|nr:hypothetical protein [Eubacteriales bacterium]
MKLDDFLKEKAFSKYKDGIDKIKDDFISSGYERFLWRKTLVEWDDASKTVKKEMNAKKYVVNENVQNFINQFACLQDSGIAFIYPESYAPNYFLIQELLKYAKADYILENLIPEDGTINHIVIFNDNKENKEVIQLMNHLVYSAILGENFGGYKLLDEHLCYYLEFCGDNSLIYTMKVPNSLMHYQGYVTRRDTNPFVLYNTRKNIEALIKKGYFETEFDLYRNLKNTLMPFLQEMYLKAEKYENGNYDWKAAKSKLTGDLIEKGVLKSKWKNEQSLYLLVKKTFPNAIFQYRPDWLSPQSLDIYIPEINVGIEYQGIQHYMEVEFFGGKKAFEHRVVLDEKKREMCRKKKVRLVEWNYNIDITNKNLQALLKEQ